MSEVYDAELRARLLSSAVRLNIRAAEGVYAFNYGPAYETPAEIRAYRTIGADAVGMSTVPEAVFDAIRSYRDEPDPVVAKVVPTTPEAMEVLMEFQDETYEKMCEGDRGANDISYLYGKAAENARRVALTIAVGRDDRNPVIERRDMEYAVAVMRYTIGCSVAEIEDSVAENEYERYKKRILAVVRKFGAGGICRQELTRKTQFVDRLKRNEIIEDLLEARQIKQEASASGGDVFKFVG